MPSVSWLPALLGMDSSTGNEMTITQTLFLVLGQIQTTLVCPHLVVLHHCKQEKEHYLAKTIYPHSYSVHPGLGWI